MQEVKKVDAVELLKLQTSAAMFAMPYICIPLVVHTVPQRELNNRTQNHNSL